MSETPSEIAARRRLESQANTYEWAGTEDQQHRERMKACRSRRKAYPDDDCDRDGSCYECEQDMAEALETPASKERRAEARAILTKDASHGE